MAFVDLHGAANGGGQGLLDVTHRRFEPVEHELLPRGRAWDPEDQLRQALVAAQCTELSRVDVRADGLLRELDPNTTFALVDDWETELGLPECAAPETLEARRAAILAKLLAQAGHGQSKGWWTEFLESLGYPPEFFLQGLEMMTCLDDCLDEVTDEEWMFVWQIYVQTGLDDALVVCFVNHNALLGSLPLVHVMWQLVPVVETLAPIYGVACTSHGFLAAVGTGPRSFFAGADFENAGGWGDTAQAVDLYAVVAVDDVLVASGIDPGNFLRSVDHGETWVTVLNATGAVMWALSPGTGEGTVIAAGENCVCWLSVDYGASWAAATDVDADVVDIKGLTRCTGAVVAVAVDGRIFRTTDNATTWTEVGDTGEQLLAAGAWELVVVVVGKNGAIERSTDAGVTFAPVVSPTTADLHGVVGTPVGRWTAVGTGGAIIQSLDNGVTWNVHPAPTTEDLFAVTRHIPTDRAVIVGDNLTIIVE